MSQSQQQQQAGGGMRQEFLADVVESGIDERLPQPALNLLSKDFPLSNIRREDREYFRLLSENVAHYVKEQFPPEESLVQGDVGAALLGEPASHTQALTTQQRNELETLLMTAFARTSRGEQGWQQDKLTENIQTRRVEDARGESGDDGGFLSEVFS
jgi:hypothetical protein